MASTPTSDFRRTAHRVPERPLEGLDAAVNWCIGAYRRRSKNCRSLLTDGERVDDMARDFADLDNHHLQEKLFEYREFFRREPRPGPAVLLPALAAIREAAVRTVKLRAFPVQISGAL